MLGLGFISCRAPEKSLFSVLCTPLVLSSPAAAAPGELAACGPEAPGLAPPGAATDCGVCCVCEAFRLGADVPVSSLAPGVNFSALVGLAAAAGPTRPLVDFNSDAVGLAGLAASACAT